MVAYEEKSKLKVDKDTELEIIRYFYQKESPCIISATGLGGAAGTCCFIDYLARDYNVITFSPRNSGSSNGHLTIDNYISDTAKVIDHFSQKVGEKPYGIGHSMGGYSLGYLLGESPLVKKAVLLAPLINITEQNLSLLNRYLTNHINQGKISKIIQKGVLLSNNFFGIFDKQRFDSQDVMSFLKSLYEASECNKKLLVPTYVVLAGRTNFRLRIKGIRGLKSAWEKLGAKVDIYPELNHWFSGTGFLGVGEPFSLCEKEGILEKICNFFGCISA